MALRSIGIQRTGRMASDRWDGGTTRDLTGRDDYLSIDHTGYRSGQTIDGNGEPVGGILVGCLYIPTRRIVGHTRSDENGNYTFDGLRENVSDYLMFAYPDDTKLGGVFDFATRYALE